MAIYRNESEDRGEPGDRIPSGDCLDLAVGVASALSDATRVRILMALVNCEPCCESGVRELCACQIVYLIGLAQSTVSKHISVLKQTGFIASRKCGRWIYFKLAEDDSPPIIRDAIDWLKRNLANDVQIVEDRAKIVEMTRMDVEEICRICLRS